MTAYILCLWIASTYMCMHAIVYSFALALCNMDIANKLRGHVHTRDCGVLLSTRHSLDNSKHGAPPCSRPAHFLLLFTTALPLNSPHVECIWDQKSRVGVVGDWLNGSSMEAAAVSGISLARRLAAQAQSQQGANAQKGLEASSHQYEIGLRDPFTPLVADSGSHDIGGFPGLRFQSGGGRTGNSQPHRQQQQQQQPVRQRSTRPSSGQNSGGRGWNKDAQGRDPGAIVRPPPQLLPVQK